MCNGWRPTHCNLSFITQDVDESGNYEVDLFKYTYGKQFRHRPTILVFPTDEIRDKFYEAYNDLIEEAKMFL